MNTRNKRQICAISCDTEYMQVSRMYTRVQLLFNFEAIISAAFPIPGPSLTIVFYVSFWRCTHNSTHNAQKAGLLPIPATLWR